MCFFPNKDFRCLSETYRSSGGERGEQGGGIRERQTCTPVTQVITACWAERPPPPSVLHKAAIRCADRVCPSVDGTRAFGIIHNGLKSRGRCSGSALLEGERVFPADCELSYSECRGNPEKWWAVLGSWCRSRWGFSSHPSRSVSWSGHRGRG